MPCVNCAPIMFTRCAMKRQNAMPVGHSRPRRRSQLSTSAAFSVNKLFQCRTNKINQSKAKRKYFSSSFFWLTEWLRAHKGESCNLMMIEPKMRESHHTRWEQSGSYLLPYFLVFSREGYLQGHSSYGNVVNIENNRLWYLLSKKLGISTKCPTPPDT